MSPLEMHKYGEERDSLMDVVDPENADAGGISAARDLRILAEEGRVAERRWPRMLAVTALGVAALCSHFAWSAVRKAGPMRNMDPRHQIEETAAVGMECCWVPVDAADCPSEAAMALLPDCTSSMAEGDLCDADSPLPSGNAHYEINNCASLAGSDGWEVFRYQCHSCNCWVAVDKSECPAEEVMTALPDCTAAMSVGDLCDADSPLPNGDANYDINNCPSSANADGWEVFRYECQKPVPTTTAPNNFTEALNDFLTPLPTPAPAPANASTTAAPATSAASTTAPAAPGASLINAAQGAASTAASLLNGQSAGAKECCWVAIDAVDCPDELTMTAMSDCTSTMKEGELCEADSVLPNGNNHYDLNNCKSSTDPDGFEVFRYTCSACTCMVTIAKEDCPSEQAMASLPDCHGTFSLGDLCEADSPLPNGDLMFNINNCPSSTDPDGWEVFRYECQKQTLTTPTTTAAPTTAAPTTAAPGPAPTPSSDWKDFASPLPTPAPVPLTTAPATMTDSCVCDQAGRDSAGDACGCAVITTQSSCAQQTWCKWLHGLKSGTGVFLKAYTGKYLDIDSIGQVRASSTIKGAGQTFRIMHPLGEGVVASADKVYLETPSGSFVKVLANDTIVQEGGGLLDNNKQFIIYKKGGKPGDALQSGDTIFLVSISKSVNLDVTDSSDPGWYVRARWLEHDAMQTFVLEV